MSGDRRIPDFDLSISTRMQSVRFDVVPEVDVRWEGTGDHRGQTWEERENLPEQLEPGVTYEDAVVRWYASGHVGDQAEIKEK